MEKRTFKQPNNTKNNTNAACKVTKHAKLALFAQYCYIRGGRNGSDHPDIETLIHSSSSQQAGEKRLNQVFSGVRGQIRSLAGAALVGSSMMLSSAAFANDSPSHQANPTTVAMNTTATPASTSTVSLKTNAPQILPDAHRPANVWAVAHPDGVAISLRLGTDRSIPLETIEQVFTNDFARQGIDTVAFFFEEGDGTLPGTGVAFHTDDYVFGPFDLVQARKAVPKTASQMQFNSTMNLQP